MLTWPVVLRFGSVGGHPELAYGSTYGNLAS